MMKSQYIRPILFFIAGSALLVAPGCKEDPVNEKWLAEQRYFDLYISSTYKDTIGPPTESGLYYIEVTEGTGDAPDADDWLLVNYVGYTIPDEEVVDTYLENVAHDHNIYSESAMYGPFKLLNGSRTAGLTEGMLKMREGGKAIICFKSDLGYGASGIDMMKSVGGYRSLKYEVELLKVIKDMDAYELSKIEAFIKPIEGVDTIHDPVTDAVMYYVVDDTTGGGSTIDNDSLVSVAYRGYLPDGREFDKSSEGEPYIFPVGDYADDRSPIKGWHLGVTRFREGEKGRLIIPYQLAYGVPGRIDGKYFTIQPFETLVFDIEIINVSRNPETDPDPGPEPQ